MASFDTDEARFEFNDGDIFEVSGKGEPEYFGSADEMMDGKFLYLIVGVLLIAVIVVMYTADGPFGPNKPFRQIWGNAWR